MVDRSINLPTAHYDGVEFQKCLRAIEAGQDDPTHMLSALTFEHTIRIAELIDEDAYDMSSKRNFEQSWEGLLFSDEPDWSLLQQNMLTSALEIIENSEWWVWVCGNYNNTQNSLDKDSNFDILISHETQKD